MTGDESLRRAQRASSGQPDDPGLAIRASREADRMGKVEPRISSRQMERTGYRRGGLLSQSKAARFVGLRETRSTLSAGAAGRIPDESRTSTTIIRPSRSGWASGSAHSSAEAVSPRSFPGFRDLEIHRDWDSRTEADKASRLKRLRGLYGQR